MINSSNRPVKVLSMADQLKIYIGLMWAHRKQRRVRDLIKEHCERIRRWQGGVPGSLGMSATGRDPCCGDGGMV